MRRAPHGNQRASNYPGTNSQRVFMKEVLKKGISRPTELIQEHVLVVPVYCRIPQARCPWGVLSEIPSRENVTKRVKPGMHNR